MTTHDDFKGALSGVLTFSPTFFQPDGRLDLDRLERHLDHLAGTGCDVIAVCGGAGEFYALRDDEYRSVIRAACGAVDGRVPVMVGVGPDTDTAAEFGEVAAVAGASGLMVNPFYFVAPDMRGVIEHYETIGARSGLGLVIFNTVAMTYSVDELTNLAEVDAVVGVKDEVGDIDAFAKAKAAIGGRFRWINGMAESHAETYGAAGADAMTSGIANFAPDVTIALWDAAVTGDAVRVGELFSRLEPMIAIRGRRRGYHITILKEALTALGRDAGLPRPPLHPFEPQDRVDLRAALEVLQIEAAKT